MGFIKTPEEEIRERNKFKQAADKDPEIKPYGYSFKGLMFDSFEEQRGTMFISPRSENSLSQDKPSVKHTTNLEDYIILEGKAHGSHSHPDLLVSKNLEHFGEDWYKTHEILNQNDQLMINLRQFIGFVNLLRSDRKVHDGNGKQIDKHKVKQILHGIIKKRNTHRSEWLDARFDMVEDGLYISYNHRTTGDGELVPLDFEPLKPCLMEDTYVAFFKFFNRQGMPTKKSKNSSLYYRCPTDNMVARFKIDSHNLNLMCDWWPTDSDPFNGVRPVQVKKY